MRTEYIRRLIYRLHERALRRPTFTYLSELEKTQWISSKEIENLQMEKLRGLLQVAMENCPWHAERIRVAGLDLNRSSMLSMDDLRLLPIMDKKDAKENVEKIVWKGVPGGAFRYNTGGSSGQPLIFYYGRLRQASDAAGRMRARQWWGVEVGDPEIYLWGAPVELKKSDRIKSLRDRLVNHLVLNAFEMSIEKMAIYVEAIRSFRPKCIYGYASSVALLAAYAQDRGFDLKLPSLNVVCTTGEPLYLYQRELIQNVFGTPVANEFGSRDIGFTAHESPRGQMLLMSESFILEVIDGEGNVVGPGELGEAVITGLCSHAQPFIRYRTGDIVRQSAEDCKEGRGLHVIGDITGRCTDFIIRQDGTIMHALAVIYILREIEGIAEFKFIQHALDVIEILVVPDDRWSSEAESRIRRGIEARLGSDVRMDIRIVDSIPSDASGKYRYVVNYVALPPGLNVACTNNNI
jgi:phenylacetate-CoA ligase